MNLGPSLHLVLFPKGFLGATPCLGALTSTACAFCAREHWVSLSPSHSLASSESDSPRIGTDAFVEIGRFCGREGKCIGRKRMFVNCKPKEQGA